MPYKYKFVKERIGQKITDPSQLIGWRDRRLELEERERQRGLEHQRELQLRREAGEVIPEDEVPAAAPVGTSTSALTSIRPATRASTAVGPRPMTRAATRAAANATNNAATTDSTSTTTTAPDAAPFTASEFAPAGVQATAPVWASLPSVTAVAVGEEHCDVEMLDPEVVEPINSDIGQEQISFPTIMKDSEKPSDRHSASIPQPASVHVGNTPTSLQSTATTANAQANPPAYAPGPSPGFAPVIDQATVGATPSDASEHLDMGLLDPALFEPINDKTVAQAVSTPNVANKKTVKPTVYRESERNSQPNNGQAGNIPANRLTIVEGATKARPTTTIPELRPVVAPPTAPAATLATTPAAVAPPTVEVEDHTAAKLPEPVTGGNTPVQIAVPSAAAGNQQIIQPATGQPEARVKAAYQLVPVVDIVNRLFLHCLAQLQSPTPEMVSAEARLFLARAQENETVGAVKKATTILSSVTQDKIDELTRRPNQFELVSEILKLRLQQVFLQGLLK